MIKISARCLRNLPLDEHSRWFSICSRLLTLTWSCPFYISTLRRVLCSHVSLRSHVRQTRRRQHACRCMSRLRTIRLYKHPYMNVGNVCNSEVQTSCNGQGFGGSIPAAHARFSASRLNHIFSICDPCLLNVRLVHFAGLYKPCIAAGHGDAAAAASAPSHAAAACRAGAFGGSAVPWFPAAQMPRPRLPGGRCMSLIV